MNRHHDARGTLRLKADGDAAPAPVVSPVRLRAPHAYVGKWGSVWSWRAGQVVTDAEEIEHLRARGAELEPVVCPDPPPSPPRP